MSPHRLQELVFCFKVSLMHSRLPLNFVLVHVLRLLIILAPLPKRWVHRCMPQLASCSAGDE